LEGVGGAGALNPFNLRGSYGDSSYDARQRFVVSYSYEIPSIRKVASFRALPRRVAEGWRIAGAATLQSGFPLGLSDGSNNSLTCWGYTAYGCPDRPNVVGAVSTYDPRSTSLVNATHAGTSTRGNYFFNPNSFAPEARGVLGDAGRNFFHGPGLNNLDFALFKDTKLNERLALQFRAEFFNLWNRVQFGMPGNQYGAGGFGDVFNQANNPRLVQLALRLEF